MIDYLLTDYLIVLAQKYCNSVAMGFDNILSNNPQCDELIKVLGEPFDASEWERLKEDTQLFKLTWKQDFPESLDGRDTFFGRLLKRELW